MREVTVGPGTFQNALDQAKPGDVLILTPGRYKSPFGLSRVHGSARAPVVIEAREPGAIITQEAPADAYRREANTTAKGLEDRRRYPGLYERMEEAQLAVRDCRHVVIRNLTFEEGWPTHLLLKMARDVTIQDCRFLDGTFAIAALEPQTKRILIEGCRWVQDRVTNRIWGDTPWYRVHGTKLSVDENGVPLYPPVDIDNDWRQFDGDFFRSSGIAGGVTIRHCAISDAFNAIHGFNNGGRVDRNLDFHVHDCTFERIRDNVLEPERRAANWWFHHNHLVDCHKTCSLTTRHNAFCLIFSNTQHFRSIQSDSDDPRWSGHRSGGIFKAPKKQTMPSGPTYVFHNSLITRSDYLRKGLIPGLIHANNVVLHATDRAQTPSRKPRVFGNPANPQPTQRFTTEWGRYEIVFDGDVQDHPDWPGTLRTQGYGDIGTNALGADPRFLGWDRAQERIIDEATLFHLHTGSPCRDRAIELELKLPWLDDDDPWISPAGADVGAYQHAGPGAPFLFQGPAYQATKWGLPTTVVPPVVA